MYSPHKSAHYLIGNSIYNWNWCHVYNPCSESMCVEMGLNLLNRYFDLRWPSFNHLLYNTEENNGVREEINIILVSYLL